VRRLVISFALGATAAAVVEVLVLVALAIVADANGWASFSVGGGPLLLLEFERTARTTTTTFGGGIGLVALAGGALNAGGAAVLVRRE
jgi:hypothetical protein